MMRGPRGGPTTVAGRRTPGSTAMTSQRAKRSTAMGPALVVAAARPVRVFFSGEGQDLRPCRRRRRRPTRSRRGRQNSPSFARSAFGLNTPANGDDAVGDAICCWPPWPRRGTLRATCQKKGERKRGGLDDALAAPFCPRRATPPPPHTHPTCAWHRCATNAPSGRRRRAQGGAPARGATTATSRSLRCFVVQEA